jgi:hypothetical protein
MTRMKVAGSDENTLGIINLLLKLYNTRPVASILNILFFVFKSFIKTKNTITTNESSYLSFLY